MLVLSFCVIMHLTYFVYSRFYQFLLENSSIWTIQVHIFSNSLRPQWQHDKRSLIMKTHMLIIFLSFAFNLKRNLNWRLKGITGVYFSAHANKSVRVMMFYTEFDNRFHNFCFISMFGDDTVTLSQMPSTIPFNICMRSVVWLFDCQIITK